MINKDQVTGVVARPVAYAFVIVVLIPRFAATNVTVRFIF